MYQWKAIIISPRENNSDQNLNGWPNKLSIKNEFLVLFTVLVNGADIVHRRIKRMKDVLYYFGNWIPIKETLFGRPDIFFGGLETRFAF